MAKRDQQTGAHVWDEDLIVPTDEVSRAFVLDLVQRGQAVRVLPGGNLPPGATHEIVGQTEDGLPILKRRRFALSRP